MAGLLYIFPLTSTYLQGVDSDNQSKTMAALQKLEKNCQPLIITGEELCGKTLLLFQAAVSYASQGHHVTFISRRPLTRMPLSVHGMMRPDVSGQLKTLTFLYMSTAQELVKYCSTIHMKTLLPDVLVIDELEYYFGQLTEPSPEAGAARLCALLVDTMAYIEMKSDEKGCILLLGCRSYRKVNLSSILKQFSITVGNITAMNLHDRSYQLSLTTSQVDVRLSYNIKPTGLFLEEMEVSNPRDDRAERNLGGASVPLSTVIPWVGNFHLEQNPI